MHEPDPRGGSRVAEAAARLVPRARSPRGPAPQQPPGSKRSLAPVLDALTAFAAQAAGVSRIDELCGVEGTAARLYFERFTAILCPDVRETFAAVGPLDRSRPPPGPARRPAPGLPRALGQRPDGHLLLSEPLSCGNAAGQKRMNSSDDGSDGVGRAAGQTQDGPLIEPGAGAFPGYPETCVDAVESTMRALWLRSV
ncbi:CRISPR-associated endonuclease Cas1 [Streptomyces sp. B15]|uniref:CRISPR-associated endonuclease Cas1 n=1 Tax=Streptomyces sp. B15 TaxID=1537797 RepID=UPI001B384C64|nr:CRISPR-associated endonuclease Cas1 [Streptomyces sp. B15]